jgi:predicted lactoylglutathione lyase
MLLVERFYETFASKQIGDTSKASEAIIAISALSGTP